MPTTNEATVVAAEHRTGAGRALDEYTRGTLTAIGRHDPTLAPRVAGVLAADQENTTPAKRKVKPRRIDGADYPREVWDLKERERRDFLDHGIVS